MKDNLLQFEVFSGGKVCIDLEKCKGCVSKVCIEACTGTGKPEAFELREGLPALRVDPAALKKGGCVECLACELDCQLYGNKGLTIVLPMPELDHYLEAAATKPVYMR
ncbi:MAG: hypothetical protein PWP65_1255 [Clostridia bacterium]|nr:hypothetical protein [Clostridia bacterium]